MKFTVTLEKDEDGFFVVECPSLPGCVSQGITEEEALGNIKDAIKGILTVRNKMGLPIPKLDS
ncbi:MAG: type II toxin-antitoxin system HicB family antitoxin [Dehalococcoidia bacterium]|nr:type II toxin-antitoxin system HicB family antitoxin [Dehalococcoidia bacterium]